MPHGQSPPPPAAPAARSTGATCRRIIGAGEDGRRHREGWASGPCRAAASQHRRAATRDPREARRIGEAVRGGLVVTLAEHGTRCTSMEVCRQCTPLRSHISRASPCVDCRAYGRRCPSRRMAPWPSMPMFVRLRACFSYIVFVLCSCSCFLHGSRIRLDVAPLPLRDFTHVLLITCFIVLSV